MMPIGSGVHPEDLPFREVPHFPQNSFLSGFSVPHSGQIIVNILEINGAH
jgi:hypothetical protein